jgi:hypothetical protein
MRARMTPQEKRKATIIKKYGSWELYLETQRKSGSKGGKLSTYRGFRDKPGLAKKANVLSRRGKK